MNFTEKRCLEVIQILRDALDIPMDPPRHIVKEAVEYLAYLQGKAAMSIAGHRPARDFLVRDTVLVVGEEDPRIRAALLAANPTEDLLGFPDPIAALEEMFGVEVEVVDGGPDDVEEDVNDDEHFANSVRAGEPDFLPGYETVTFPAKETFTVHAGEDEARASSVKDTCADAAQEAEHLHAETGTVHVVRGPDCQVWYTSKGSPED